jgi:hypothetical protein
MNYNSIISIMPKIATPAYDADAQLFFNAQTAAGVTLTTTQKNAVNQLVVDSKAAGIWTKFKAIYPIVGGTATSHKFNLKNALDTDAAFRLVFAGGLTHSSNGILGNGTNGWANTFLNPSIIFPSGFASMGFYNRTAITNLAYFMGVALSSVNFFRIQSFTGNLMRHTSKGTAQTNHTVTDRLGFHANSRTSNTLLTSIDNTGAFQTNTTTVSGAYPILDIPLFSANSSVTGIGTYINAELSFAYVSDALSSGELTSLKTINQTFQTTLGRQVI